MKIHRWTGVLEKQLLKRQKKKQKKTWYNNLFPKEKMIPSFLKPIIFFKKSTINSIIMILTFWIKIYLLIEDSAIKVT